MSESTPPVATAAPSPPESNRTFIGWRVVSAAFVAQLLSTGLTFAAFGNFVLPVTEEFGITRGEMNRAMSIGLLVMGVMGPVVGHWLDRGHVRRLFLVGLTVAAGGLIAMSGASELWQLGLLFGGVVAVGTSLFALNASMALVACWFVRRRGFAMGVAVAGATLASFAVPPTAALMIDAVGWRGALVGMALAALAIGIPVFATSVISRPELVGQRPDGDPPDPEPSSPTTEEVPTEVKTGDLVRDPRLWLIALGFGFVFTSPVVMLLSLVPFGQDLGFSGLEAAWFFTAAAPFSLFGKLVFGALADRIRAHVAIWVVVLVNILAWAALYTDPGYSAFLAIGAIYGIGIGATAPLNGVVIARCFGREGYGRASGLGGLAVLPLLATMPEVSGRIFDATGGYHAVFAMMVGLLLFGGALLSLVRIPRT